jgi:hypothetical protein
MPSATSNNTDGPAESKTLSPATFEIHRRVVPYAFGLLVCSVFIAVWMLERFFGIGAEFIVSVGFSAFIFLFVTPVALLIVYLLINGEPVVAVRGSYLHITSPTFAWRKTVLPIRDVLSIETDWLPDTSHARIIFSVTPERFAEQNRSGPWIKRKDNKLYLDLLNTDHTPEDAARNLRRVLQHAVPE